MKTNYSFISVAALLLMFTACNKENAQPDVLPAVEGRQIQLTVSATRGGEEVTKTNITPNDNYGSLESKWAGDEVIHVYSNASKKDLGTLSIVKSSIVNEGGGTVGQFATSKAEFSGSITVDEADGDVASDTFIFMYLGKDNDTKTFEENSEELSFTLSSPIADYSGIAKWDIARGTGKLLASAGKYTCSVSFSNLLSFAYFSTQDLDKDISAVMKNVITINPFTAQVIGTEGDAVTLEKGKTFYLPLVNGVVSISADKTWENGSYTEYSHPSFTVTAGGQYWRLGKMQNYGPIKFTKETTVYDNLATSKFRVGESSYVRFTPGNLQYIGSGENNYWKLASTQYETFGDVVSNKPATASNSSFTFTGDLDLFGWGEVGKLEDGKLVFQGANGTTPTNANTLYLGTADWQEAAAVTTPANKAIVSLPENRNWAKLFGTGEGKSTLYIDKNASPEVTYSVTGDYKVLTADEWMNLFYYQKFAFVTVTDKGNKTGIVVFPYNVNSIDGINEVKQLEKSGNDITSTLSGIQGEFAKNQVKSSIIEDNHALFLPVTGRRDGASVNNTGVGYYWSSTASSATLAYLVRFLGSSFVSQYNDDRCFGYAVRLASVVSE